MPEYGPPIARDPLHEDRIERLDPVFYIRWTSGPDYEKAFICVEDGEPDMNDIACVSFNRAIGFAEWYRHAMKLHGTDAKSLPEAPDPAWPATCSVCGVNPPSFWNRLIENFSCTPCFVRDADSQ